MKKTFVILLAVLIVFGLCSCKKEEPVVIVEDAEEMKKTELVGGWKEVQEEIDEELSEIFTKAMEGYTGMSFTPLRLVKKQLVSGMNYKFLCEGQAVVPDAKKGYYLVTVYRNLKGECKITGVEESTQEF